MWPTRAYPILTPRLELRPLIDADAEALHAYRSIPENCLYVPFEPMDRERIAEKLAGDWRRVRMSGPGESIILGAARRDTGQVIGDLTLMWHSETHRAGEIGWIIHPAQGGQGFATEAALAMLALAFDDLGLHRVRARIDTRNDASARLAERLGMRREAHLIENEWFKGAWGSEFQYALLETEWRDRRR